MFLAKARTPRNAAATRGRLLEAAFAEIYRHGFQGAGLDGILAGANVTKGALYHHFETKEALGYAVVDEVIGEVTREKWIRPLEQSPDPVAALMAIVQASSTSPESVTGGCPLNNLATEMSPLDEGFRTRLAGLFALWRDGIASALRRGQRRRLVKQEIDPRETALCFIAMYEGYISLAKSAQDPAILRAGKRSMIRFLESLKGTSK